jgi:hypothetical protein
MYKHECVNCLVLNGLRCKWNIGFIDRFLGNENIICCPEYIKIIKKLEKKNK